MSLRSAVPGPLSTIQDGGRFGFRSFGVPISGPFDRRSALVANALVSNPVGAAVLEMTSYGGLFEAESTMAIGLAGAAVDGFVIRLDGSRTDLRIPCATTLRAGDRLHLPPRKTTNSYRSYLSVRGGWHHRVRLGSWSDETPISKGMRLNSESSETPNRHTPLEGREADDFPIRFLDGPDSGLFLESLENRPFRVQPDSNRIGVRLSGELIGIETIANRQSTPVAPGTIQIAGGLPIVLGPACGTMGGYPHIGQVITCDLDRIGQLRPGAAVSFQRITLTQARELDQVYRKELESLWIRLSEACAPG